MGIDITIEGDTIIIKQSRPINGRILNQKELYERAREIYPEAKVVPVVYSLDVDMITLDWISGKMDEFGIKHNDLVKQLAIDKSSLSSIFSGDRGLSKGQKAAFFFYFLSYELNRDFRRKNETGTR